MIEFKKGDCIDVTAKIQTGRFNLTFCSPPYSGQRKYGIGFNLTGEAWVDWAISRFRECLRVTDGLVAWVVQGPTSKFQWDPTPALLMARLHQQGAILRCPPIYRRVGIPGSGGPDWLRCDTEFIVCATRDRGALKWSDNTACGLPPKYAAGGACSHRRADGSRANAYRESAGYAKPKIANPGNVVRWTPSESEVIHLLWRYSRAIKQTQYETMHQLQTAIRKKALSEWCDGVAETVYGSQILLSALYGKRKRKASCVSEGGGAGEVACAADVQGDEVFEVREQEASASSSSGRKSHQQRGIKHCDSVQGLPQRAASGHAASEELPSVWREASFIRSLRRSLPQIQDAWRSVEEVHQQQNARGGDRSNVIHGAVGGGLMGHPLATENEAPFPLWLAEFFVKSFCPPGGEVFDPFCGSGTTGHACLLHGRRHFGVDIRQSQVQLARRRIRDVEKTK